MSEILIADSKGVKPGEDGYVKTIEPAVVEGDKPNTAHEGDKPNKPESIPYGRFDEVNTKRKDAEAKIIKMEEDQKKINEKKLEEDGKIKELWETEKAEHVKTKETADKWTVYEKERREALMAKIPEKVRDIYDGMSLVKLEKAVETISKDGSLGVNVEDPSRHTDMTAEERKKLHTGTAQEKRDSHEKLIASYQKNRK